MEVKRIVTNIAASDVSKARQFYADILGLSIVMDLGWIVTFESRARAAPQVSVAMHGGSDTAVPDISVEATTWTKLLAAFVLPAFQSSMAQRLNLGVFADSMSETHLAGS
jgi:catechol 2,3-dioxygenase-like lactoylglutathione lyase family enzyme